MTFRLKLNSTEFNDARIVTMRRGVAMSSITETEFVGKTPLPTTIVVSLADPAELLTALVMLDGNVENISLISAGTPDEEIRRRMEPLGEYTIVSEDPKLTDSILLEQLISTFAPTADGCDSTWYLSTSGTTSKPKLVGHTFESLTRSTKSSAKREFIWGMLYDAYRFAGVQVLMQSVLSGNSIVFPDLDDDIAKQIQFFAAENVNAISATPTLWRKILMTEESARLPLRTITLGGEIADERILKAVTATYPEAKIRHIYASTEAGTGFSVVDGKEGFPLSYLTDGPGGIRIRIEDDKLMIHNPLVKKNYVGDDTSFVGSDGFVDTGDIVKVIGDRVVFLGRSNGVINVGGNKVYPEHVENVLQQVPHVSLARVYGLKNSIIGQLVCAEIVATTGSDPEEIKEQLFETANSKLHKHERPIKYNFVETIQHTQNGKVQR